MSYVTMCAPPPSPPPTLSIAPPDTPYANTSGGEE